MGEKDSPATTHAASEPALTHASVDVKACHNDRCSFEKDLEKMTSKPKLCVCVFLNRQSKTHTKK